MLALPTRRETGWPSGKMVVFNYTVSVCLVRIQFWFVWCHPSLQVRDACLGQWSVSDQDRNEVAVCPRPKNEFQLEERGAG